MAQHYKHKDDVRREKERSDSVTMVGQTDRYTDWLKSLCTADVESESVHSVQWDNCIQEHANKCQICMVTLWERKKNPTYSPFTSQFVPNCGLWFKIKYQINRSEQDVLYEWRDVFMGPKYRDSGGECISKAFIEGRGKALTGTKGKAMWYHQQSSEHYQQQKTLL